MRIYQLLFLVLFCPSVFAQQFNVELKDGNPKYTSIVDVFLGDTEYYENIESDYEVGFKYRLVITRSEIYESLYIEKLITDVEGFIQKIEWAKTMDMNSLIDLLKISHEQRHFSNIKWVTTNQIEFELGNIKLYGVITDDADQVIIVER